MPELIAFAPFHASAVAIRSSTSTTLRVLLGATFVTDTDAALLATDPEALDDEDLLWLSRSSEPGAPPRFTALASPWRVRVPRGEVEVTKDAPLSITEIDWARAAIEVGDQWLASPTMRPVIFLVIAGDRRRAAPELCRVDFARWRDRLRTVWRYELTVSATENVDEVHVGVGDDDAHAPNGGSATPWKEVRRFPIEERHPLEDTVSALEIPTSVALPFVELPRHETVELRPLGTPLAKETPASTTTPTTAERRTIGELLADGRTKPFSGPTELDHAGQASDEVPLARQKRIDVLWYEEGSARRARKEPRLKAFFPKIRWAASGTEETEERHRRDLMSMLRDAPRSSLAALAAGQPDVSSDDASSMYVVRGDLEPEFDESAILAATVAATFVLRSEHPMLERTVAEAERALAEAPLTEVPFIARSATERILVAVRAVEKMAAEDLTRNVERALVRRRCFANRELDGRTFVRARISAGGAPESRCVAYLAAAGAEKLPLLLSMSSRLLVHVLPPQEEGDNANCLVIDVLARET